MSKYTNDKFYGNNNLNPQPVFFTNNLTDETISPQEWIEDQSKTENTRVARKRWASVYSEANGFKSITELVESIREGKVNIYASARVFMDFLRKKNASPNTLSSYRSWIIPFWGSCIGEDSFKSSVFQRQVPPVKAYRLKGKRVPLMDQVRYLCQLATPQYRALIGVLLSGLRIGEAVSRRWKDVEERPEGYARV